MELLRQFWGLLDLASHLRMCFLLDAASHESGLIGGLHGQRLRRARRSSRGPGKGLRRAGRDPLVSRFPRGWVKRGDFPSGKNTNDAPLELTLGQNSRKQKKHRHLGPILETDSIYGNKKMVRIDEKSIQNHEHRKMMNIQQINKIMLFFQSHFKKY